MTKRILSGAVAVLLSGCGGADLPGDSGAQDETLSGFRADFPSSRDSCH